MTALTVLLDRILAGHLPTPEEGLQLATVPATEFEPVRQAADQLRRQWVGDRVSYVVNRNLNFTNICEQHCSFCAFRRDADQPGAFRHSTDDLVAKAREAAAAGATELCLQGGLDPAAKVRGRSLDFYLALVDALKRAEPQLHLHAFSPQEVQFIAREDNLEFVTVLRELQRAGVGSLPGTAAEVLDDDLRRILCPEKIDSATWRTIVHQAHALGLPTTSTLLSGHLETPAQRIAHLDQLRQLQQAARDCPAGITEFVLLPFVGAMAPAPLRARVRRDQPDPAEALRLQAIARLYLGALIPNHQPSWVKLGLPVAAEALDWGCNDIGGTLMEEHITSMAGARGGTCQSVGALRDAIAARGRIPVQRDTLYRPIETPAARALV